jgi:hypothetical protein
MRDDILQPGGSHQHVPAGNPLLSFRVTPDLDAAIHVCAAARGISHTEWSRNILQQAVLEQSVEDPDSRFVEEFTRWWTSRGRGDPRHIYGMKMRAQGRGLSLAKKLRETLKQMLDQGLL